MKFAWQVLFFGLLLNGVSSFARADEAAPAAKITYDEHVQPILRQHCFTCHGESDAKSDLRVDNFAALMRGGASGEVVTAGDADSSRLWALVSHAESPEMPPDQDKLPEPELNTIKEWITQGALENSGSVAKVKAKPKVELKVSVGAGKPAGPAAMPEGLSRQPIVHTSRAAAVTAIAASPWAPVVAIAGQKQISLYHTETSRLLGVLPFPEGTPYVLKFSRSGALLLAGGGRGGHSGKVVLFDVTNGQRVAEIGDELDAVLAADINDDHTQVALGGPKKIVRIFSVADGSLLFEIKKHTDWVTSIEYSPDGVLLATGDRSNGLFVWEAETAREYQNLKGHNLGITSVSWRGDANLLASASEDGTIKLWEMENGSLIKSWDAHGGGAACVSFSHDGRLVSAGRDRVVKIWDANGAQLRAFDAFHDLALQCVFTHDDAQVAAGDWTGEVRLWNVADGALVGNLLSNPPTLQMFAEAEAAKAQAAVFAAEQAAANAAAATKSLEEKSAALAEIAARLSALQAEAAQLTADRAAMEQAANQATAAAQAATDAVAAAKAAADTAHAEANQAAQAANVTAQANSGK
ncbi:MAG: c-type cytochrome domain-containing protein [Planctomycetia bacterium]|nr:c-type cytochrome domain-containing protein [Planctomycetia bacterium]